MIDGENQEAVGEVLASSTKIPKILPLSPKPLKSKRVKATLAIVVFLGLIVFTIHGISVVTSPGKGVDSAKYQGKVALSIQELYDVVVAEHLNVYWTGPLPGAKYALIALKPGEAHVRYLPGGTGLSDPTPDSYREVSTYDQPSALLVIRLLSQQVGYAGFTSQDGNSVAYKTVRPTHVYVGLMGVDYQLEISDPKPGVALALAAVARQIQKIA